MNYRSGWLTLNRVCNLRCKWCYAQKTGFKLSDDLEIDLAYKLIDIYKELGINRVCLIGGEPTVYKHLIEIIRYLKRNKINITLITNGVLLSDDKFLDTLINNGVNNISISLKGENEEIYKDITGVDCYNKVMEAINNCSKKNIKFSVSMVLTNENINTYTEGLKDAYLAGARNFNLSFCYEFNLTKEYNDYLSKSNPKDIIDGFVKSYNELDRVTNHRFNLFQTFPLCLWDKDFIDLLVKRNQVSSVCQLQTKSGLLFDTFGNIIPCNAMFELKLGKYGVDFIDGNSLIKHMDNNNQIQKIYNRLCGLPSLKCLDCKKVLNCGGGCVCQWTNYSYDKIIGKGIENEL